MTKTEIIAELSKRLGDPNAAAFSDRIWGYFMEALYELLPSVTIAESINLTNVATGTVTTDILGNAKPNHSTQMQWNAVVSVEAAGIVATPIEAAEYKLMLENSFYAPEADEAYYYFNGSQLVLLTGLTSRLITYKVHYVTDIHATLSGLYPTTDLPIPNSFIYKAYPLTITKVKQEIGLTV
jgi:hypothetical protein